jgi:hypothetical protein
VPQVGVGAPGVRGELARSRGLSGGAAGPSPDVLLDGLLHGRQPVRVGADRGRELGRRGVVTG